MTADLQLERPDWALDPAEAVARCARFIAETLEQSGQQGLVLEAIPDRLAKPAAKTKPKTGARKAKKPAAKRARPAAAKPAGDAPKPKPTNKPRGRTVPSLPRKD